MKLSRLIFTISFCFSFPCQAQTLEESGRYFPDLLDSSLISAAMESPGLKTDFDYSPKQENSIKESPTEYSLKWRRFWDGSKAEAHSGMKATFTFTNSNSDKPQFKTDIDLQDETLLVRLSNPFSAKFAGGIRMSYPEKETKVVLFEGSERRSVIIVVPPISDKNFRSVILCPRHFEEEATPFEVPTLRDTAFHVTEFKPEVEGYAQGRFTTIQTEAFAEAAVKVSEGTQVGAPFEDVARMIDPSVRVIYKPDTKEVNYQVKDLLSTGVVRGVKSQVNFVSPAGYERLIWHETRFYAKEFSQTEPGGVVIAGIVHPFDSGTCVLISRQDTVGEEFKGPALYKASEGTPPPESEISS